MIPNKRYINKFMTNMRLYDAIVPPSYGIDATQIPKGTIFVYKQDYDHTEEWFFLPEYNKYVFAWLGWHKAALTPEPMLCGKVWRNLK